MVKFHIFALTAASVLSLASARACTTGLSYCGYNLRNLGDYSWEIDAELRKKGIHSTENNMNNALFS